MKEAASFPTGRLFRRVADLISAARALAALPFAWLLPAAPGSPAAVAALLLFTFAAASDFADGRLARRLGSASGAGTLLDHGADILFLTSGFAACAAAGRIGWEIPLAVALSFAAYAAEAALSGGARSCAAADRIGHAGGVVNWVFLGTLAVSGALPAAAAALPFAVPAGAVAVLLCASATIAARALILLRHMRRRCGPLAGCGRGVVD